MIQHTEPSVNHADPLVGKIVYAAPGSEMRDFHDNPFPIGERFRVFEPFTIDKYILDRLDGPDDMAHIRFIGKATDFVLENPLV